LLLNSNAVRIRSEEQSQVEQHRQQTDVETANPK
jgi:hypothetical protein